MKSIRWIVCTVALLIAGCCHTKTSIGVSYCLPSRIAEETGNVALTFNVTSDGSISSVKSATK